MTETGSHRDDDVAADCHLVERRDEEPCSVAVVRAVADVRECNPLALPELLYDAIDGDALDLLFPTPIEGRPESKSVSFRYCGYTVTVRSETVALVREETTY